MSLIEANAAINRLAEKLMIPTERMIESYIINGYIIFPLIFVFFYCNIIHSIF